MIIFGTRGITMNGDQGKFHCPQCNDHIDYRVKNVRRFFTLYFIPLIPLDKLGDYVECQRCKGTYNSQVLDYDPQQASAEFEAEWLRAIKKVMASVLLADGEVKDEEITTFCDIYEKISGSCISPEQVNREINDVIQVGLDLNLYLRKLQGNLNSEGKEIVLKAALYIALADGEFHETEQAMIADIGTSLGMSQAHINGVISSI